MRMNIKRGWSFLILLLVYLLAAGAGIGVYALLPLPFWLDLLIADVAATVVVFAFSLIFDNASVYDPYWSVQPIVILLGYTLFSKITVSSILPLVAVLIWGVRLTANWAYTFKGLYFQDWRYTMLKEKTKKAYFFVNFVGIHLVPTLVVYACVLPAVFTAVYAPAFRAGSAIFFSGSLLAVLLQGAADIQMHRYRKHRTTPFLRTGLWKYARHPNYLGEILMWWCVGLAAVCLMPDRWYLLAGALLNTLLFVFVSVPLADGRQSEKPGFEQYKKNTRIFLPIYKKQT